MLALEVTFCFVFGEFIIGLWALWENNALALRQSEKGVVLATSPSHITGFIN